jgi:anti-anti-sigma factor
MRKEPLHHTWKKGTFTYAETSFPVSCIFMIARARRLDLKETTYLDSFGLGVLVSVYLTAKRQQRQLKLINVNQQAQQLLRITNLIYLIE